jgi:ATP-binding cassette subfamily B protein
MRDVLTGSLRMLGTAWRMNRRKTVVSVTLMVAGTLAAPLLAAALGWMTNTAFAGDAGRTVFAGVVVATLAIVMLSFTHFAHIGYFELSELAELDFDQQLVTLSNGSPGIEHHERAEHADALTVLQQESRRFRMGLEALLNCMGLALAMISTAVLLASLNPVLLLLPLAAVPPLLAGRLAERVLDRAKTTVAEPARVALNLFHLSTSARAAGELRVFRLRDALVSRHTRLWETVTRETWRAYLVAAWIRAAGQIIFALAYVGAVLLVVRDAIAGRQSVGDVVLVVALAAQVSQQVTMAVTQLQNLQRMASAYRRLADVREFVTAAAGPPAPTAPAAAAPTSTAPISIAPATTALTPTASTQAALTPTGPASPTNGWPAALPQRLREGITLTGVGFSYPGTDTPVIRGIDLTIPAGATVAVVGDNGAGKTTLVKLLCGFYRPTVGSIRVDGVDLSRIPIEDWRQRIAAGFQDFVRYEFSAQYAVGLGDLPRASSAPAVRAALDRAHALDVLDRLPEGLDSQLGKSYADGAELSGGQWQKLALGRALMRTAPLLLVLDEPASALDPEAEHALFERYAEQARRVSDTTGAITLFVSHRFSTVRMADLIVVVQDGRVLESGDHATLVARGGLYAELFALQEKAYR